MFNTRFKIILAWIALGLLLGSCTDKADDESSAKSTASMSQAGQLEDRSKFPTFASFSDFYNEFRFVEGESSATTEVSIPSLKEAIAGGKNAIDFLAFIEEELQKIAKIQAALEASDDTQLEQLIKKDVDELHDIVGSLLSSDHEITTSDVLARSLKGASESEISTTFASFLAKVDDKSSTYSGLGAEKTALQDSFFKSVTKDEDERKAFAASLTELTTSLKDLKAKLSSSTALLEIQKFLHKSIQSLSLFGQAYAFIFDVGGLFAVVGSFTTSSSDRWTHPDYKTEPNTGKYAGCSDEAQTTEECLAEIAAKEE